MSTLVRFQRPSSLNGPKSKYQRKGVQTLTPDEQADPSRAAVASSAALSGWKSLKRRASSGLLLFASLCK